MNSLRLIALILWVPFLLEASFIPFFTFSIPGFPLTLGRICLLMLGVVGLNIKKTNFRPSPFRLVVALLLIGSLAGTFFSQNLRRDLISYLGILLLFISTFGSSRLISLPETQKLLKYFFVGTYTYWVIYVLNMTISGAELTTYGEIYRAGRETDKSLINYHSFGLVISCGILYISQLSGWLKKLNLLGLVYITIGIMAIFLTESRANFLITLLTLLTMFAVNNRASISLIFRISIILIFFVYLGNLAMMNNERLNRRFDVQNVEYIEQTTSSRFILIGLTFEEVKELPFGGGVRNNRVNYYGTEYQPHNQYLTFVLFAGIFGVAAVIIWFILFTDVFLRVSRARLDHYKPHLSALIVTMLTMFTNDLSGAYFFLMIILQVWLSQEVVGRQILKFQ